jgi:glycosyltransferase involved in cell wall biosynthesis
MLRALEHHYGRLARGRVVFNGRRPASFPPKAVMSVAPADVTAGATAGATAGTAAAVTAVTADAIAAAISGDTAALKQPFVLCAGRLWDEAKNVAALCAIAPALSWPVYVAGEVSDPSGHHLAPAPPAGVRYLGPLGEHTLAAWMAQASIYALPARYEPFGLSVLEAAQAGCALVLGDIASLREVWGDAAVYVPPDDREALRYELAALIDDGRRRGVLAERSRRRAGTLTVERMAAGYTDTYREIADEVRSVLPLRAV